MPPSIFKIRALTAPDLRRAVDALRQGQTHRILLTLITDDLGALARKFAQIEKYRAADPVVAETICGYHLEGPFMSPEDGYRGAHPGEYMRAPDLAAFQLDLQGCSGREHSPAFTLAPEWPGSTEFIGAVTAPREWSSPSATPMPAKRRSMKRFVPARR